MSESLSMVKDSQRKTRDSAPNRKVAAPKRRVGKIGTGLITAITTIAVSFIAIVPQLRRGDAKQVEELKAQIISTQEQANSARPTISTEKKQNIYGTVLTEDGKGTLRSVEVYLVPAGLTATTDVDDGSFNLQSIPAGAYSMIIRNSEGKSSRVNMVFPIDEKHLKQFRAKIKYQIEQLR